MIRDYNESDFDKVVQLLELNTPQFFDPSEEQDFINYLLNEREDYFVVEKENEIVGVGGVNYNVGKQKETRFSWDMVHPKKKGLGIGQSLVEYRVALVKRIGKGKIITIRTSQLAFLFYEKFKFELKSVEKDYWAKGLDLYLMELKIN